MSKDEPSNAVLAEMINGIHMLMQEHKEQDTRDHEMIISRLNITNGQVAKNTAFRQRTGPLFGFVIAGIAAGITTVVSKLIG